MEINLSKWQTVVFDDPHRFKVVNVGRRAGKTLVSVIKLIQVASEGNKTCWYVAPTYRQAKNIAWSILKEYMPPKAKAIWNETELKCLLPGVKSEIHLKGADNPDSLRGTHIDFAIFDEVAFFANWKDTWQALRPILVDSKAPAWFISTPNGLNHFYQLYNIKDPDYTSFHFTTYDNPYVDQLEIDKAKREMDELTFRQEFLAEFTRPSGVVYREWPVENYKAIDYNPALPLHLTFDWGVNDPTSIIWIQPYKSETRIIDYYEASNASIEHFISVIRSKSYKEPELYTGDPAGKQRTLTTGTSVIDILSQKGIYVRTKDGVTIPEQIRLTHQKIKGLYISDKAQRFRDCVLNYRYPEVNPAIRNQENEVPIHDEYSHGMRAFEYWCVNYSPITEDLELPPDDSGMFHGGWY